jgi:elongation factor 1-beta
LRKKAEEDKKEKEKEKKEKKGDKPALIAKSIVLLDIKVWEMEQDLGVLATKIFNEVQKEGLVWKTEPQFIDIAFGIKKLRIGCVIEDEKVSVDDDIVDVLQAWEEEVQSVDIHSFNKL